MIIRQRLILPVVTICILAASTSQRHALLAADDASENREATLAAIRVIADRFLEWQGPYGRLDPKRCPLTNQSSELQLKHLHSPTFASIGMYHAFQATGDLRYKEAADRYALMYIAWLRNPADDGPETLSERQLRLLGDRHGVDPLANRNHVPSVPYMYGMALASYRDFQKHNPDDRTLSAKASALFEWMLAYRWDEGSYFRNGYPAGQMKDAANSDDNCHIGRGLMGYYQVNQLPMVLAEAEGLAEYYLTEVKPESFQGCWSSKLGTWVVAPNTLTKFENLEGFRSCDTGWGYSSVGAIEFLTDLAAATNNAGLKQRIAEKCVRSMKWQFDDCQFDDGACGLRTRDDKWLGMTAGAILSYLRTEQAGFLSSSDVATYEPKMRSARRWLVKNVTPATVKAGGYFRVTGQSDPHPGDNLIWLFGWTLEALNRSLGQQ